MTTQIPKYLFAIFVFLLHHYSFSQQIQTIAFYNVENLFDTIDGPNDDAEFLPSAESKWDAPKYEAKLVHIRQVMAELNISHDEAAVLLNKYGSVRKAVEASK